MRVGLLYPTSEYTVGVRWMLNGGVVTPYLARRLADYDIEAHCLDLGALGVDENAIVPMLPEYDAIGITAMTVQAEGARRLIKIIKHNTPSMYVACGGPDVTLHPEKYLEWGADSATVGDADGNIQDIFTDAPKGIVQGKAGPIGGRPLWENHRPLPWQYPGHPDPPALPEALAMSGRGCPHNCKMCSNPHRNQRVRRREVDDVVEETEWFAGHGIRSIFWYDDEIVDRGNLAHFASILEATPKGLVHRALGRCDIDRPGDAELLSSLSNHGLRRVMWGVETISQKVLDAIDKHLSVDDVQKTLENAHSVGIQNYLFLMSGMPEEGEKEMDETYEWAKKGVESGLIYNLQVSPCYPMEGSQLYEDSKRDGWFFEGDLLNARVAAGTPWASQGAIAEHTARLWALVRR